ncbi:hypothetical protein ACHAWF_004110 [Thalassiosira exigua]
MKRMNDRASTNKSAIALGRDMLKRPTQRHNIDTTIDEEGDERMSTSVSTSALSSHISNGNGTRRPSRNRSKNNMTLKDSFTMFLQNSPQDEIEAMTKQILDSVNKKKMRPNNGANATFSPVHVRGRRKGSKAGRRRSASINNADLPMVWLGSYKPVSSSRRNSGVAGTELAASMKLNAQKLLAELGDLVSDDDDDDLGLGVLDEEMETMKEVVKFNDETMEAVKFND